MKRNTGLFFLAITFCSTIGQAANISSTVTGGLWSLPTSWAGGVVPTATDNVTIVSGATITLATGIPARTATTTVNTGGSLLINVASTFSGTNTINGTLTLGANLTGNLALTGTLATSGVAARTLTGTVTSTGGAITPLAAAPLTITGTVTQSSGTLAYSGGTLTLTNGLAVNGGTFTDGGALTLSGSSTLVVSAGANLAVNSASTFSGTNTISGTLTLGANLTGNLTLAGGTVTTSGSDRTLTGNITSTTGSSIIAPAASTQLFVTGTLTSSGGATDNLTINGLGKLSVNNFTLNSDANATISSSGYVTVRNDLYLDNKANLTINGVVIVKGNFDAQNNGNITTGGSGAFSAQGTVTSKGTNSVQGSVNYCIAADPCIANPPSGSDCYNVCLTLGGTPGTALPITLVSFTTNYQQSDSRVKFEWVTASETNNDYFTVERSADGRAFGVVLTLKGAGNSRERLAYVAYDEAPLPGLSYYRLKQTDFDGQFTYSKLTVAENTETAVFGFSVAPNPVNGQQVNLLLRGGGDSSVWVSVYAGSLGQVVHEGSYPVEAGNKLSLSLPSSLPGGMYWVKVNQAGRIASRKIIVMNQ